jgi:1-deoxy-D-xylulose-5-phosphate synthase
MNILDTVKSIEDLKKLNLNELKILSEQIREYLISTLKITGGHLASNLGAVELTIALHYVFNSPDDKLIWDIGHQSYVHKILTGRAEGLKSIRQFGGISGFPKRAESPHDIFETGHASTSISAALGLARARDILNENYSVIAVVGDGAMTGGMTYEALNDISNSSAKVLIILNDNQMSISKNVGGLSKYLTKLRVSHGYKTVKRGFKNLRRIPLVGRFIYNFFARLKSGLKSLFIKDLYFETFDLSYAGPVDGHDIKSLIAILEKIKKDDGPQLLHVITKKGKGYKAAEDAPEIFHGISENFVAAEENTAEENSFSLTLGQTLCEMAETDKNIAVITAAMPEGTGVNEFKKRYPKRFFDIGIAEQHAVTLAAGLSVGKIKPYVAIYSTFLQRAFDQIITDVCLQRLNAVFCIDRAGLSGADGETHQGAFDLSYLSLIPNMTVFAPKDRQELKNVLQWSRSFDAPLAIRYPKNATKSYETHTPIKLGQWEQIASGGKTTLLAVGNRMLDIADGVKNILQDKGVDVSIINARFVKPLDGEALSRLIGDGHLLVTLEDNSLIGGFYSAVSAFNQRQKTPAKILPFGIPDKFITHGKVSQLFDLINLTPEFVAAEIYAEIAKNIIV